MPSKNLILFEKTAKPAYRFDLLPGNLIFLARKQLVAILQTTDSYRAKYSKKFQYENHA